MIEKDFQNSIKQGIPENLPNKKPFEVNINHAPKRKDILTIDEFIQEL